MPAGAIIGAAGSVAGGLASGKGAKKAAKYQLQATRESNALLQSLYNQNQANFQPTIDSGNRATGQLDRLLGLVPLGEGESIESIFHDTPGYDFRMSEALRGVNSNAYARGTANSGATLKALTDRAMDVADQSFNQYVGQVGDVANRGLGATSSLAGVSNAFGQQVSANNQNAADARSNAALAQAGAFQSMLNGLGNAAGQIFSGKPTYGSSYGSTTTPPYGTPPYYPGPNFTSTGPFSGFFGR